MKSIATIGLLSLVGPAFASTTYTVTNLNQSASGASCGLASNGNVVCDSGQGIQVYHYATGTTTTGNFAPVLPLYTNASGEVAGNSTSFNVPTFFNGSLPTLLPIPNGYTYANVSGLDDNGDVVGTLGTSPTQGIIWTNGSGSIIVNGPSSNGGFYLSPSGIWAAYNTAAGDVIYNLATHGTVLVDSFGGAALRGVSDSGIVVGFNASSIYNAYEASVAGGVVQICPTLSNCSGASTLQGVPLVADNALGQAVGTAAVTGGLGHAFLYSGGQLQDLNSLLASNLNSVLGGSGWYVALATAINNNGQILAAAYNGSTYQEVLLTPVTSSTPEPATAVLLTLGLAILYYFKRQRLIAN